MRRLDCSSVEQYLALLENEPGEKVELLANLRVTISRFFRDRFLWTYLADTIFPLLLQKQKRLRIWSAGCSCGEELYSISLLLRTVFHHFSNYSLVGTDAEAASLRRAGEGRFPYSSLRELSEDMRRGCFQKDQNSNEYLILPEFRENLQLQQQNFLETLPENRFEMILLRNNLLTYHDPGQRQVTLLKILTVLEPGGYLVVGSHERVPERVSGLTKMLECPMIYQRL